MYRALLTTILVTLLSLPVYAQDEDSDNTCPTIVNSAITTASGACADTGRNEACYGNLRLQAQPHADAPALTFEQAGDKANLSDIASLETSAMNTETGEWGVALLRLQANLPGTIPGQNVTFLLFGDAEVVNAADSDSEYTAPMQAFLFRSGINDAQCEQAPDSGMLIQTPEGEAEVSLNVNGVDVSLGSTMVVQNVNPDAMNGDMMGGDSTESDDRMSESSDAGAMGDDGTGQQTPPVVEFSVLEGNATLTANGTTQMLEAGQWSNVTLDENLQPISPPSEPSSISADMLTGLPLSLLEREVDVESLPLEETMDMDSSSGMIVPQSGTWQVSNIEISTEGCPAMMTSAMQNVSGQIPLASGELDFSGGFNPEIIRSQTTEPFPTGTAFSQPEPNVIEVSFTEQGSTSIVFRYEAVSETMIAVNGQIDTGIQGCVVNFDTTMTHQGE